MAWVEKRQTAKGVKYYGCYRGPDSRKRKTSPQPTKTAARKLAEDAEAAMRRGEWIDPAKSKITFRDWVKEWWELYDYKPTTESGYYSMLHRHLLPRWGDVPLRGIEPLAVEAWVRELRALRKPDGSAYSEYHIQSIRRLLHTILDDAVAYEFLGSNPAGIRRRGRRATPKPAPRTLHVDPLTALLFAERAALLTQRDDEFYAAVTLAYTGKRWAELVGMTRRYVWTRERRLFVEVAMPEVNGRFREGAPKTYASRREIRLPPFLADLLAAWLARDEREYLYTAPGGGHAAGSYLGDAAWRPAADGWYPARKNRHGNPIGGRPVLVDMTAGFPGRPHRPAWPPAVEGEEYAAPRARGVRRFPPDGHPASWLPLSPGLSAHDLRRSHRTWLQDAGIPSGAAEARMGHAVPGVEAVYNVVTEAQQQALVDSLEDRWWAALARRRQISETTPVAALAPWLEMAAQRESSGEIQWDMCPPFAPQKLYNELSTTR